MRTAEAAALSGAYRPAIDLVQAALGAEPVVEPDPLRTGTLLERLAVYHLGSGNPDAAQPVALRALDCLPADPPSVARAQVLGVLAQALGLKCHFSESNRIAQEALSTARAVGSAAAEIRALGCIGRNAAAVGKADSGVRTLREALGLARSVGDFTGAAEISIELALALHWAGDLDEACHVAEEGIAESSRWGAEGYYGGALRAIRGVSAFLLGRWPEAADWISGALERDPVGSHGVLAHGAQALLDLGRGALDSAAEHLEIVLLMCKALTATAYGWTDLYSSIALLSIARGQPSEAIDSVRESLARSAEPERDVHMRVCHRPAIRAAADLAEVARPLGDAAGLDQALAIGREFDERLDRHAQTRRRSAWWGRPTPGPRRGTGQGRAEPAGGSTERGCVGRRGGRGRYAAASPRGCLQPIPPGRGNPALTRVSGRRADRCEGGAPDRIRTGSRPTPTGDRTAGRAVTARPREPA